VYPFKAADGVEIRLTRYRGGAKGPVMLSHGLGVSSLIFSIDTIDTNLLEYLYANGYDVWLLDYRASIALPASALQSNGDQVAKLDYPAAVALIRQVTGAPSIQAVVHCYGASTFTMAMLAGLEGVRSIVISQISAHVVSSALVGMKTGLHLPNVLDALGIKSLTAQADKGERWWEYLGDKAASAFSLIAAEGLCDSATCHRITFMYASLYEHSQLNQGTHDALHELFGAANISAFEHIAVMGRKGQVVSATGADDYLPHLERLNVPICFIHGSKNACFLPESTAKTYDLLRSRYGDDRFSRHVIPGYGHIDCIFGSNAATDVYPHMLAHLEKTASA
jgi:cholesterol oxidase